MTKKKDLIPLSVPNMGEKELKYVSDAVGTGWISSAGGYVNDFENNIAEYAGVPNAVACQSGTSGLHLALLTSGVKSGELVIVPTLTFIAAVNPVIYVGADPVFMDCDDSLCMDPYKLRSFCEEQCFIRNDILIHKETQKKVSAVVVVHVLGNMADMEAIIKIANNFHLIIIEDATEALGTKYTDGMFKDKMAGSIGDIGVYSFNGNKIITTGGGGMVISQNLELLKKVRYLSTQAKDDELFFVHDEIGYNYRMTNVQAAIGVAQLMRLEEFIHIKEENYNIYVDMLAHNDKLSLLPYRKNTRPNYWMYGVCYPDRTSRDLAISKLAESGIQARPIWSLIHLQKCYHGAIIYKIEKALNYADRLLNPPCSSNLRKDDAKRVACEVSKTV